MCALTCVFLVSLEPGSRLMCGCRSFFGLCFSSSFPCPLFFVMSVCFSCAPLRFFWSCLSSRSFSFLCDFASWSLLSFSVFSGVFLVHVFWVFVFVPVPPVCLCSASFWLFSLACLSLFSFSPFLLGLEGVWAFGVLALCVGWSVQRRDVCLLVHAASPSGPLFPSLFLFVLISLVQDVDYPAGWTGQPGLGSQQPPPRCYWYHKGLQVGGSILLSGFGGVTSPGTRIIFG